MSDQTLLRAQAGQSPFDVIVHREVDGREWWSAREMVSYLGYTEWRNIENAVKKAKLACENSDHQVADHFVDVNKMVDIGSRAQRALADVQLSRFGCYLLAMNGDPEKPEVAAAQRYFALMTRVAETMVAAPAAFAAGPRPWGERFRQTFTPHVRYVNTHFDDAFTVVTTLSTQLLVLEDELVRHLFEPGASDRPDVSIGLCWGHERRKRGYAPTTMEAPLRLPDRDMDVWIKVYGNAERGEFESWFHRQYMPDKLPGYLGGKKEFRSLGPLPPASVADNACLQLTGRPANLKPALRTQLEAAGGFVPARPGIAAVRPHRAISS